MKSKNVWIVILFLVGAVSLTMVEGYLKPEAEAKEEQYRMEQKNPLTHDFESVLPYKHKYMGDAGNLGNLNYHLPLSDIPKTFQLFPEEYKVELIFELDAANIDERLLKQALLYNATANFVLIDNLQTYQMSFTDGAYSISRDAAEKWYGVSFADLQEKEKWNQIVRDPLADASYVERFFTQVVKKVE
ncbi:MULTISPECIES: DUF4825 domain-containing protein [Brevibacillus]|jgi:hypothetical protein|uniref:DUF4825 domain-containing protein n=1 Tax=Brevibacillus TaxID=55080 RepID=UPI0014902233|nr:DUF4825 domain-containing protein [Brevibacillus borstelensis]MCC0563982.1 DUF4825 domain-containing protein [Brevibacillus borstelensis]MCM3470287.1 DUF4825 domain-containing protein [Brevibacillus borstelensis]MCM3558123.1 DUF4825 domain-containing protein [Brevibacillus borstelensis]MCM3593888.1 DUF4825 domain-containing protein [Brevibacillus borstelensis]MCM3621126.1 DUF4825 domain-containing protein [Brevibacillus borstelensis]